MWKIGAGTSVTSSASTSIVCMPLALFHQRLPWVSIAPFGPAGGSGGVHDQRDVVLARPDLRRGRRRPGDPFRLVLGGERRLQRRQPRELRLDHGAMGVVDDQHARRAIVDHEGEFRPGEAEIERHEDRPEPGGGEHGEQEHRLVETEKGDPVAGLDPDRGEPAGAILDFALHCAIGPVAALEMQRPALGRPERRARGTSSRAQCPASSVPPRQLFYRARSIVARTSIPLRPSLRAKGEATMTKAERRMDCFVALRSAQ